MPKRLCKVNIKELKPLSHLKGTFILFLPTIATSIYTVLDKTLIGLIITDTYTVEEDGVEIVKKVSDLENGYYEQAEKLIKMVMTVITCIGTVMIPRNTKELSLGNYDKVKENITLSSKIVMLIALPMILGIVVVSPFVVPWFFGSGYDKCVILMQILSPLIIIIGFSNVFGLQYLIPAGKDFKYTIAVTIGAIVNLILNSIFIYFWWSIGAAIATIIAECFVTIIMAIMVRKELNIFKVILSSWKAIISSVIMFVAIFFIAKKLDHNVLNTFIIIGIGALLYLTLIILLRDKIVLSTLRKILNKFKKKKENKDEIIQQ
jgi:O-antigen/teichoic acid export membrane protein